MQDLRRDKQFSDLSPKYYPLQSERTDASQQCAGSVEQRSQGTLTDAVTTNPMPPPYVEVCQMLHENLNNFPCIRNRAIRSHEGKDLDPVDFAPNLAHCADGLPM